MEDLSDAFLDSLDTLTTLPAGKAADVTSDSQSSQDLSDEDYDRATHVELQPVIPIQTRVAQVEMALGVHSSRGVATIAENGDEFEESEQEQMDVITELDSTGSHNTDVFATFYGDTVVKVSRLYNGDGNDRSFSFASECTEFSPINSPQEVSFADDRQTNYEQRLEASVADHASRSGRGDNSETQSTGQKQFTMEDLRYFDPHFGRDVFLEELGESFVDGSGSRSLVSYRVSSTQVTTESASDVIKQGWLMKRAEVVRSWHKRWFTLRRMPQGLMLTYSRSDSPNAQAKVIDLTSTSRCMVPQKPSKENEFRILTSADSSRKEYAVYAKSNFELTEWVRAIQSSINDGNKNICDGGVGFQHIWDETGIQGLIVRYGVRKVSARNHLQTRVLELNFADQTIIISRRGETLTTLHFSDLLGVLIPSPNPKWSNEHHGLVLDFNGKHRSWPLYLDTAETRDDLLDILQKVASKDVRGDDLETRCSRLRLKSGYMERRNVGPQATLKGRLFVCLYENSIVFYPEVVDLKCSRPWYVVTLRGLKVVCNEGKGGLGLGRLLLKCSSVQECREWYNAIMGAISLPQEVVDVELRERGKIRSAFHTSVFRLRKLLKANVKPEVNGPPKDHKTIDLMIRKLWELTFPGEAFTSNADPRWQEIGFQRGGPASDLRSSGLLGLYCLIYFVTYPSGEFTRILDRTRFGVSEGNMKNYPLAIGCINVCSILMETLGFGDAGSHSERSSPSAMKTFVRFIANAVSGHALLDEIERGSLSGQALGLFDRWEEIVLEADNHVFEDIFCILFPVLDHLFVEMGAGYMEFGQVVAAFRRRIGVIFDAQPKTLDELKTLAAEPCTDTLVEPSIISKTTR
ncbi:hypothetical protein Poli38472_013874 [Pythium oligandrum]|uniref:Uncharacterized protein n=1 Tax=Pythium oligandrum TaxID=41045 RepID=A0A8K1FD25_PYTOL|nr:hypothetical protein Poli38472_013874 [Pythium oligandrum]|eukprot:TMW55112.1 hypothetical protein Poli38472_013874 [Pythium oligandrum]